MQFSRRILFPLGASMGGALFLFSTLLGAADPWTESASQLAAKIVARTSAGHVMALSVRNVSSLSDDDVAQIRRSVRAQLRSLGVRLAASKAASLQIQMTLSENVEGLLWVAEIRKGASHEVVMITVPPPKPEVVRLSFPTLSLRKTPLFERAEVMLDVLPLEALPSGAVSKILVLGLEDVSVYENLQDGSGWKLVQSAPLARSQPGARDPRGRLVGGRNNTFDAYLQSTKCGGAIDPALHLDCHESADPWPLAVAGFPEVGADFAAGRNYFDGGLHFSDGRTLKSPPFFSAAALPLKSGALWLLAGLDGRAQLLDSNGGINAMPGSWGSNVATVQSGCQDGWSVLADQPGDFGETDSVQAYFISNRKAVAAGAPEDFAGPVTEIRPLSDGTTVLIVSRNLKTNSYEASRLSITCGQ